MRKLRLCGIAAALLMGMRGCGTSLLPVYAQAVVQPSGPWVWTFLPFHYPGAGGVEQAADLGFYAGAYPAADYSWVPVRINGAWVGDWIFEKSVTEPFLPVYCDNPACAFSFQLAADAPSWVLTHPQSLWTWTPVTLSGTLYGYWVTQINPGEQPPMTAAPAA